METRAEPPDIIIIDDDESGRSETRYLVHTDHAIDSDADISSLKKRSNKKRCRKNANGFSVGHSENLGRSYDDDCFIVQSPIECEPSHLYWTLHRREPKGEKRPAITKHALNFSSSSVDCEIIEDLDGKARQDWEKAALKKRFGDSYIGGSFRAESEESSSAAGSSVRRACYEKGKGPFLHSDCKSEKVDFYESGSSRDPSDKDKYSSRVSLLDQQDSNSDIADTRSEDSVDSSGEETFVTNTGSLSSAKNRELSEEGASCSYHNSGLEDSCLWERFQSEDVLDRQEDVTLNHSAAVQAAPKLPGDTLLLLHASARETEEPEWVHLQKELRRRQAEETQCEQKKRKLDNQLKLAIDTRQKQRPEEIRINRDEMNAVYKEASPCFHPDWVAALAKNDPVHWVQAEETFELL